MITNQKSRANAGFTPIHAVMAVGLVSVVLLAFFGLPSGVKDFFAKFGGKATGLASISAFGEFGDATSNLNIEEIAKIIHKDLTNVKTATQSEEGDVKNGICFKNASGSANGQAGEKDFYNIVSAVKNGNACADGESIKTVVSLPGDTFFTDPTANNSKYVVFQKNGTITSNQDISIKISNSTGVRMIVITPSGVITYTDQIPGVVTSRGQTRSTTVVINNTSAEAARLANIAAGLAGVMNGINGLQNQSVVVPQPNTVIIQANAVAPGQTVLSLSAPVFSPYNTKVDLNWSKPADGSSQIIAYRIYRSGVLINEVPYSSYTDSLSIPNTTFCYAVSARNLQSEGARSNSQCITTPAAPAVVAQNVAPNAPSNFSVTPQNGQIYLSWSQPYSGSSNIVSYKVYRNYGSGTLSLFNSTRANAYTDVNLSAGQTYCYYVTAVNSTNESNASEVKCAVPTVAVVQNPPVTYVPTRPVYYYVPQPNYYASTPTYTSTPINYYYVPPSNNYTSTPMVYTPVSTYTSTPMTYVPTGSSTTYTSTPMTYVSTGSPTSTASYTSTPMNYVSTGSSASKSNYASTPMNYVSTSSSLPMAYTPVSSNIVSNPLTTYTSTPMIYVSTSSLAVNGATNISTPMNYVSTSSTPMAYKPVTSFAPSTPSNSNTFTPMMYGGVSASTPMNYVATGSSIQMDYNSTIRPTPANNTVANISFTPMVYGSSTTQMNYGTNTTSALMNYNSNLSTSMPYNSSSTPMTYVSTGSTSR